MESANVEVTQQRNANKAEVMFKLSSTNKINSTDYRFYFNSCNLEHVLHNALKDFSDDEKEEMSDAFAEKYKGHLPEFISFISDPDIAVSGHTGRLGSLLQRTNILYSDIQICI